MGANLKEVASSIAQNVRRSGGNDGQGYAFNQENWNIFNCIADVFDSVKYETIKKNRSSKRNYSNPITDIIKMLTDNNDNLNSVLSIDEKNLTAVFEKIAEMLFNQQNSFEVQINSLAEERQQSYRELETPYSHVKEQVSKYKSQRKFIAEYVQHLMTKNGASTELARILEIMEMKAVFPAEIDEEKIPQYFTVLKTDLPDNACISPCIIFGEEILVHGEIIQYVKKIQ